MNRSSTLTMGGVLLNDRADQAIVVEVLAAEQSGEFYLAVFGDFMSAADNSQRRFEQVGKRLSSMADDQ
jgi:hypothetical protein